MEGKPPLLSDFPYLDYSMSPTIRQYLSFSFLITQLNSDKHNKIKSRTLDVNSRALVLNTNNVKEGDAYVRQWGAVVHVHFWVQTKAITSLNTDYVILTKLPNALYSGQSGQVAVSKSNMEDCFAIVTDTGELKIHVGHVSISEVYISSGFTYIAKTDTW